MEAPVAKKARSAAQIAAFERCLKAREEAILRKHQKADPPAPEAPVPHPPPVAEPQPVEPVAAGAPLAEDADQYVDFDPDGVYDALNRARGEMAEMQTSLQGLRAQHGEMQAEWHRHGVRQANALNFV